MKRNGFLMSILRCVFVVLFAALTVIMGSVILRDPDGTAGKFTDEQLFFGMTDSEETLESAPAPIQTSDPTPTPAPTPEPTPVPTPEPTPARAETNPASGTVLYYFYGSQPAKLSVENAYNQDCLVILKDQSVGEALKFFVRTGEECTVDAPVGVYAVSAAAGYEWKDTESLFGPETVKFDVIPDLTIAWGAEVSLMIDR